MKPSWDKDGLTFLGRLLSLSNLKKRWLIEETKVKGEEPNKVETIFFIDRWIKRLEDLKNEIGVDSKTYWKNTHGAMKKISERLVKLANKVGQLY